MFRVSTPPRRKTWTKTLSPTAAFAVRDMRDEGPRPIPTAAAEAPRRKTRREASKGMFMILLLPDLRLGAGEQKGRDPRRRAGIGDPGVHADDRVESALVERAAVDRAVRGLGDRGGTRHVRAHRE